MPADSEWACQAWGELALMKDEAGDFDGAIEAIERCKQVQRLHEEAVRGRLRARPRGDAGR